MEKDFRNRISKLLLGFGIPPSLLGFEYIIEAVAVWEPCKPTMAIYKAIAEKYNSEPLRVERCIRHALDKMSNEAQNSYFKGIKASNGNCIAYIYWKESEELK